jgi:hypothetical protein
MLLEQRHPYSRIAVASTPELSGLLYLYVLDRLVWVQWDANVRARLQDLYERFPEATDFSYSACSSNDGKPAAETLRSAYQLTDRQVPAEPLSLTAAAGR